MAAHRTVAKHSYLTGKDKGVERARAHVNYIQFRAGKDQEKEERTFFNGLRDDIYNKEVKAAIAEQDPRNTVMHKLILSPGVAGADVKEYAREVMAELGSKKGLDLDWYAVEHNNTDNPHCHIVIMGKDENGRNVRIYKKDYEIVKEAGDRYLERNKLLERDKERDVEKEERIREQQEKEWQRQDQERTETRAREDQERQSQREEEDRRLELERQEGDNERDNELSKEELAEQRQLEQEERQFEREQQDRERAEVRESEDKERELWRTREREGQRIEREKAERERDLERDSKGTANLLLEALKAAAKEFARTLSKNEKEKEPEKNETDYQRRKREREEERDHEKSLLGEDLDIDTKLLIDQKKEERQQSEKEKAWKEYCKPIEINLPLGDGTTYAISYDRSSSLDSLKDLRTDYKNGEKTSRDSISKEDFEKISAWIKEKEKEIIRIDTKAEKLAEIDIAVDTEHEERWSSTSSLEELRRLEELHNNREVYLDPVEEKALQNWIDAQELKEPIRIEHERAEIPVLYGREDSQDVLAVLLDEHESGKVEGLNQKDYEKLKTWIAEKNATPVKEQDRAIAVFEEAENKTNEFSRESELSELKGLASEFLSGESSLSEKDYKEIKVWISDKEYEKDELDKFYSGRKEAEFEAKEKAELVEKPIEYFEWHESAGDGETHQFDKTEKLETLKKIEQSYREEPDKHVLKPEDYEKVKTWIADKEANEINHGGDVYSKDTELEKLQQFRQELIEGRYEDRLEKEKFSQLCSWIGKKESEEKRQDKEKENKEKEEQKAQEAAKQAGQQARKERCREIKAERQSGKPGKKRVEKEPDKEIDEDAIKYVDGRSFDKNMPLTQLREFREELMGARYERRLEEEEYSKLCSWIGTKEKHGDDAFKSKTAEKGKKLGRSDREKRDEKDYVPRRKLSALEKRMQRAVRQEKAERLKAYYAEKALQRERIERELHERKWEHLSEDKTVLQSVVQFVNLLRQGASKLKEEKEREARIKERDLERAGQKTEKPVPKGEAKPTAKPVALPYPEPKSHLEELANRMALERAQLNKTKAELDREIEKKTGGKDKPTKAIEKPLGKDSKNPDKPKESKVKDREEKNRDDDRGGR